MTKRLLHFTFLLTFLCGGLTVRGQSEITIRFIGNCGLHLTDGTTQMYLDFPYKSGAHNYMEYDQSEIANIKDNATFIFTHRHADHYSEKILKKLKGPKFDPWNVDALQKWAATVNDLDIKPFKTEHKVFGVSFRHYSYLITWHGKKIFISGDTENADTFGTLKDIDWTFAPVWLLIDAKEKGIQRREISKQMAVYHIGPKDNITTDDPELKLLKTSGEIIVINY